MPPRPPLETHVARSLRSAGLAGRDALLLAGVSGGPDSTALLAALVALREELALRLHVVHVDHGLRPEGRGDAAYVRRLAQRWGVPVSIRRAGVRERQRRRRTSLEEAAREARYAAMAEVARDTDAEAVLVAHTADDQVETVLLSLLRGAGLRGMTGMKAVAALPPAPGEPPPPAAPLVRPLLDVSRPEIEDYLRARRLRPRQDASNLTHDHLRNRVRHKLVPLLESLRPGARNALHRAAASAKEALDYLEERTAEVWGSVVSEGQAGTLGLRTKPFLALHSALRTLVLQRGVESMAGSRHGFSARHWGAMEQVLTTGTPGSSLNLPLGLQLTRLSGEGVLSRGPFPCPLPPVESCALALPGETRAGGWAFEATATEGETFALAAALSEDASLWLPGPLTIGLPVDPRRRLAVRTRHPGDRIRLRGGSRKLQDVFTDARIPRGWRDRVPVVYDLDGGIILWVVGVAASTSMRPHSSRAGEASSMTA